MNISRAFLKMLVVLTMILVSSAHAQTSSRPDSITFLDKIYSLAWKAGEVNDGIALYLPEGESLPHYKDMLNVEYIRGRSATDQVQAQIQYLQGYGSNAKILDLIEYTPSGEVLLVFMFSILPMNENERIVEWSAYRYIPMQTGNEKQEDVRVFSHSRRIYSNDENSIIRFLEDVNDKQSAWINAVVRAQVP